MDHPPAMSGKVSSTIRVRISRGEHVRPLIVEARVIKRLGQVDGTHRAIVEHEGRQLMVRHSMVHGVWQPV
jgi:hypothetical protein